MRDSPVVLNVECLSGSLEPLHLVVREEGGRRLWTLRERPVGGILWFTKFRAAFSLTIHMTGSGGDYVLYRPAGLFRSSYEVRRPDGEVLYRIAGRWRGWSLRDRDDFELAEVRYSNPFIVGVDRGVLTARGGTRVVEYRLAPLGFWSSRWEAELRFLGSREEWEIPGVALVAVRLAGKQGR